MPFLVFQNGALVSIDSVNGVMNERASIFYKKIQDIFFSWQIEKYADFMSEKSKAKFGHSKHFMYLCRQIKTKNNE